MLKDEMGKFDEDVQASNEWLTPQDIAQELKVNQQSVRNWLRDGLLVGAKFGDVWRVRRSAFEKFVQEAIRRGQRFEPSEEVQTLLNASGFKLLDRYGDAQQVDVFVDLDPTDSSRQEVGLQSRRVEKRSDSGAPGYDGETWIEDSDEQPYSGLRVEGTSHNDVIFKLLQAIQELELRQGRIKNRDGIERSEA